MKRYEEIDVLKGIAVICMVVFHFFYFPNQYGFKEIRYNTPLLNIIAKIAQIIFITSVGINLSFSKLSAIKQEKEKELNKKSISRILKIAGYAICMSVFSWLLFGEKYIKFGILHFIAVISLILFNYADDIKIIQTLFIVSLVIYYLIINTPDLFKNIPDKTIADSFRPMMPKEWKNNPTAWLSTIDINKVMKQYEKNRDSRTA